MNLTFTLKLPAWLFILLLIYQITVLVLKLFAVIGWSWLIVLIPCVIIGVICFLLLTVAVIKRIVTIK